MNDQLSSDLASLRIDRDTPQPPSTLKKLVVPLLVVGALGAVAVVGWQRVQGELFKHEVKTTEVAMISPSQADVQVTATGYVIPQVTSHVGSKLPGRLAKVFVKEGDTVKEGQLIAQLEDNDQRSALFATTSRVGVAKAHIATARAQLNELTTQIDREQALVKSGAVGHANLDDMLARQASLREQVASAEAETKSAQADVGTVDIGLKDRTIIAPISGRIVTKPATPGEFVGGIGNPEPIAEIVDFSSMMVEVDVPEPRLHLIRIGGPCEIILDAYPNKRFRCETATLGQRVNRSKATVMVKVRFDPNDDISEVLPDMSARCSFLSKKINDADKDQQPKKVVAADAVVDRGGSKVVFAIAEGKLHAIPVKVGSNVGANAVELLDGPPPGTKVVAKPNNDTTDGQRIKETDQ